MAPEVMCAQNHSFFVDFFAVGVMAFEFMHGVRPYLGKSRKEIKDLILAKQVQIKSGDIVEGWSIEAADFINKVSKFFFVKNFFCLKNLKNKTKKKQNFFVKQKFFDIK